MTHTHNYNRRHYWSAEENIKAVLIDIGNISRHFMADAGVQLERRWKCNGKEAQRAASDKAPRT